MVGQLVRSLSKSWACLLTGEYAETNDERIDRSASTSPSRTHLKVQLQKVEHHHLLLQSHASILGVDLLLRYRIEKRAVRTSCCVSNLLALITYTDQSRYIDSDDQNET